MSGRGRDRSSHDHGWHGPRGPHGPHFSPGRPPWAGFFERGPGGFSGFGPRPPKVKRGDVRLGVLAVLGEGDRNGYQIIQEIAERSKGEWRPSPGSIYPTLQVLEDEGLVEADRPSGRRSFGLTEAGQAYVAEHAAEIDEMWSSLTEATKENDPQDLRTTIGQVMGAAAQVAFAGTPEQREQAKQVLFDARRKLYQILADGSDESGDTGTARQGEGPGVR